MVTFLVDFTKYIGPAILLSAGLSITFAAIVHDRRNH